LTKTDCRCFNGWKGPQCDQRICDIICLHGKCDFVEVKPDPDEAYEDIKESNSPNPHTNKNKPLIKE